MLKIWCVGMVKNEGDVIVETVTHLASEGVDGVLVADNMSTDDTREQLGVAASLVDIPVVVVDDPVVAFNQSQKMSGLAERAAREFGAEWIVPFDADEFWLHKDMSLRSALTAADAAGQRVVDATILNHVRVEGDGVLWGQRWGLAERMPCRDVVVNRWGKVAFRWEPGAVVEMGNHGVNVKRGRDGGVVLEIRHFQRRSPEQFARKLLDGATAYEASSLDERFGVHWREQSGRSFESLVDEFWELLVGVEVVVDPAPIRRWLKPNGATKQVETPVDRVQQRSVRRLTDEGSGASVAKRKQQQLGRGGLQRHSGVFVLTPTIPGRENLLVECVESVEAQSFPVTQHLVGLDEKFEGPAVVRNRLLEQVPDDGLVSFIDDDDVWLTNHLAVLADLREVSKADVVYSMARIEGRPGWDPQRRRFDEQLLRQQNYIPLNGLISAGLLKQVGGFPTDVSYEDWGLWLRLLDVGASFRCSRKITWRYRFGDWDSRSKEIWRGDRVGD